MQVKRSSHTASQEEANVSLPSAGAATGVSNGHSPSSAPPPVDPFWGSTSKTKAESAGAHGGGVTREVGGGQGQTGAKNGAKEREKVLGSNFLFVRPGGGDGVWEERGGGAGRPLHLLFLLLTKMAHLRGTLALPHGKEWMRRTDAGVWKLSRLSLHTLWRSLRKRCPWCVVIRSLCMTQICTRQTA